MSALRVLSRRASRPHLSSRYRLLHRHQSAQSSPSLISPSSPLPEAATHSQISSVTSAASVASSQSFLRRNRGALIWGTLGLSIGLLAGNAVVHTISPPAMPDFGTPGDVLLTADLHQRIDNEFKVKVLRGKCLGVTKQLRGGEPAGWVEIVPRAGPSQDAVLRKSDGLIETLQGAKGFGVERIFWDRGDEKLVAIVWFGGAVSGWPGITHGGMIATQLSEKLALAAALSDQQHGRTRRRGNADNISTAAVPQRLPGTGSHAKMYVPEQTPVEPAQLTLSYVKPTYANNFYVIRVAPALALERDPAHIVPGEPASGIHEWEATLESMDSKVNVKAKATFGASTLLARVEGKVVENTKQAYSEFKQWLWPSRQSSSQETA